MATANITLSLDAVQGLGDISKAAITDDLNGITKTDGTVTTDPVALSGVKGMTAGTNTVTIPGYGTLTLTDGSPVTAKFTADAAAPEGTYAFINHGSTVTFTTADMSLMTNAFTLSAAQNTTLTKLLTGSGADVIHTAEYTALAAVTTGAGKDTITSSGNCNLAVNIDAGDGDDTVSLDAKEYTGKITLGSGADKLVVADGAAKAALTDYSYTDGDKIYATDNDLSKAALHTDGTFVTGDAKVTITGGAALDGSVYKTLAAKSETAATKEYWTAKADTKSVTMDASAVTNAITLDASGAAAASITTSKTKDDKIILGADTAATIVSSKTTEGTETVTGFTLGKDGDVVDIGTRDLSALSFDGGAKMTAVVNNTATNTVTIDGVVQGQTGGDIVNVMMSGKTKKVGYVTPGYRLVATGDMDMYVGAASNSSLDASKLTSGTNEWNLSDTAKFKNITKIAGTSLGGGYYIGTMSTVASYIDLSADATKGNTTLYGGAGNDYYTLAGGRAKGDTIVFGTNDGYDEVVGFSAGFETKNDVVNLYDVSSLMNDVTYDKGGLSTSVVLKLDGNDNTVSLVGAGNDRTTQLRLKDSTGTVKKVSAGIVSGGDASVQASGADYAIGYTDGANVLQLANEAEAATTVLDLRDTTKYKNFKSVDATAADTGSTVYMIGKADQENTLRAGGKTAVLYGAAGQKDSFYGLYGTATTYLFGAKDGKDTITNIQAGDTLWFYDQADAAAVARNVTLSGTAFTYDASNKLTADGLVANTIYNIKTADGTNTYKARVSSGGTAAAYDADTKLYLGDTTTVNSINVDAASGETKTVYLGNGTDGATVGDSYYNGFRRVIGSGNGTLVLAGSANKVESISAEATTGGTNYLWGGGVNMDYLIGSLSANAKDVFLFGTTDGIDTATNVGAADVIDFYDVTSIDSVAVSGKSGEYVFTMGNAVLNTELKDSELKAGVTFEISGGKQYTYDTTNKAFVAKA